MEKWPMNYLRVPIEYVEDDPLNRYANIIFWLPGIPTSQNAFIFRDAMAGYITNNTMDIPILKESEEGLHLLAPIAAKGHHILQIVGKESVTYDETCKRYVYSRPKG